MGALASNWALRTEESSTSACCVYLITGRCSKRSKAAFVAYASQAHEGNF